MLLRASTSKCTARVVTALHFQLSVTVHPCHGSISVVSLCVSATRLGRFVFPYESILLTLTVSPPFRSPGQIEFNLQRGHHLLSAVGVESGAELLRRVRRGFLIRPRRSHVHRATVSLPEAVCHPPGTHPAVQLSTAFPLVRSVPV